MSKKMISIVAVAGLVFAVAPAGAAIYQWDAVAGGDSAVQDGGGTWQVGVGNWQVDTPAIDQPWVDGNDAVFGGGASGTAGTVTVTGAVAAVNLTFNNPFAGNYTLGGGGTVSAEQLIIDGPGTVTLDGTVALGNDVIDNPAWRVHNDGTLNIAGDVTAVDGNDGEITSNAGAVNITGTFTSGGRDQLLRGGTVTLSGTGRWNLRGSGIFTVGNGGNEVAVLNIQDDAVLDVDRTVGYTGYWTLGSLVVNMGWGPCTGTVNQDGGTVNLDRPIEALYATDWEGGPGLVLGGVRTTDTVSSTYNLNGGTLFTSGVYNTSGIWDNGVVSDPADWDQTAIFNFNGGLLRASQDDSTDPDVIAEGFAHFMGNLSHAWVKAGGAIVDTNTFDASIDQALEHDPALGATLDGGLQKLGDGTLTLLQPSTYTGDTAVDAGTLGTATASLDDESSVAIAAAAMMDLDFVGFDRIAGLTLGGVAQDPGLYNSTTDPAYFSLGTGSLLVISPGTPELVWNGGADAWTAVNWLPDGSPPLTNPSSGAEMVVNSGTVTISSTVVPAGTLSIARDAAGGTVTIAATTGTLLVGDVTVATGGALNVNGDLTGGGGLAITGGGVTVASGGSATIANEVNVDAAGSLTVGGALNVPILTTAGTTDLTGATGTITTVNVTGGTTTLASPTIAQVNAIGGILNAAGSGVTNLLVDGATANTTAAAAVTDLQVDSGQVNLVSGSLSVTTATLTGGGVNASANALVVSDTAALGLLTITTSGPVFELTGANLRDVPTPRTVTVTGGTVTMTVGGDPLPTGIDLPNTTVQLTGSTTLGLRPVGEAEPPTHAEFAGVALGAGNTLTIATDAISIPLTVASLTGDGTINGNVTGVTVIGTVAPGNSIGAITVAGDLAVGGSTYPVEVSGSGVAPIAGTNNDLLAATGNVTVGTIGVDLTWLVGAKIGADGDGKFGGEYTIVTGGTVTGAPADVTINSFVAKFPDGHTVDLWESYYHDVTGPGDVLVSVGPADPFTDKVTVTLPQVLRGDSTLDGRVMMNDALPIILNWQKTVPAGTGWELGNFNFDDKIMMNDALEIVLSWGQKTDADPPGPNPAGAVEAAAVADRATAVYDAATGFVWLEVNSALAYLQIIDPNSSGELGAKDPDGTKPFVGYHPLMAAALLEDERPHHVGEMNFGGLPQTAGPHMYVEAVPGILEEDFDLDLYTAALDWTDATVDVVWTPEPATMTLLLMGGALVLARRRRRK